MPLTGVKNVVLVCPPNPTESRQNCPSRLIDNEALWQEPVIERMPSKSLTSNV